jgi:cytochrome c oxidase subunit I
MLNNTMGYIHFWVTFIGVYLVFFPQHYLGIAGLPRRYYQYSTFDLWDGKYADLTILSTIAALVTFGAQILFLFNFFYSMYKGKKASQNPWKSNTLEWTTPINPGHGNWEGEIPAVYRWPYDYSKPGAADDFIPQNVPFSATPESNLPEENEQIKNEKEIEGIKFDYSIPD